MSIGLAIESMNPWWRDPRERAAGRFPIRRQLFDRARFELNARQDSAPRAIVIVGPKQVGKSTLAWQLIDHELDVGLRPQNVVFIDFANQAFDDRRPPSIDAALAVLPASADTSEPRFIVLDEVTQSPNWARGLKSLIDETRRSGRPDRVLVTDSSAHLLRDGAIEYLQGRIVELPLTGLLFMEFVDLHRREGEALEAVLLRTRALESYLSTGGFPAYYRAADPRKTRADIAKDADLAIYRDLVRTGIDTERARKLFGYLARESGSIFVATERARDMNDGHGDAPDWRSVQGWLTALREACLVAELPPHRALDRKQKAKAQLGARPKVYAADHAHVTAMSTLLDPLSNHDVRGRVFETVVFTHLRALQAELGFQLGYLRDEKLGEMDFVLQSGDRTVGIEVTKSERLERKSHLPELASKHEIDDLVVVHGGRTTTELAGGRSVGLEAFLIDVRGHLRL